MITRKIKVSVIMGVYNCRNYNLLKQSIMSIINQTYTDWEFLICNDGSTDDTLEKLNELKKLDSRIKILSYEENKGLANALNTCLKNANGDFIARQDDDDVSYPNRLERQVKFLENNPQYAFVGTLADICDKNGIWGIYRVDECPDKKSFFWNSPFIHPSIMVRRTMYECVCGYRVAKETRRCEDYDMFMRAYAKGFSGYNIQEKLYKYTYENSPDKKYRPMKYRIDEMIVRYKGFKEMGILIKGIPYIIKPILVGMIPASILSKIKKKQHC